MWYDNEITQGILHKKYLHDGENTFEDLVDRVSSIYSDDIREAVRQALLNADFCPAGRTLYAAGMKGKGKKLSLSNCYCCTTPEDSLESISAVDYEMSKIGSQGGGVGVALDKIRPKGAKINNSARISEGVSFCLHKFNTTGESIGQNSRHMAMMVMLDCKHPDIYEFLHIKENNEKLSAMNITIKMADDFLRAVENNEEYELYFKVESTGEEIRRIINAREFFEEFCKVNVDWGDPGICYIDKVRSYHLLSGYPEYQIDTSNPCSEFFGIAGNACNLGSINLYNLVNNKFTDNAEIDYGKFEKLIRLGVKCLDETLDYGYDMQPMDMHRECIDAWRSIGLGVFGLADMFVAMKVKYGSKESIKLVSDIFDFMNKIALDESCNLAKEKGTFGKYDWNKIKKSPIISALRLDSRGIEIYDKIEKYGLRNGTLLVIAPTGCQKKETLVATDNGLLRLDEIVDVNGAKWQERGDLTAIQEKESNVITKGFINGYAHTKKIKLYSGIELESTFNHQYRVIRDGVYQWCRADELRVGDIVPSRIGYYNKKDYCKLVHPTYENYNGNSKKVVFPEILDEKMAFILGCYFANGSTKKNGGSPKYKVIRFAMNANKEDDINKLMEYCYDVFGVRPRISIAKNRQSCVDMYIASVNLCNLFADNGLIKDKSYELHIPRIIRQSPRSVIESFIDGYYMCDGSHSGNNKYIDTVSYQLAQELAVVFRALGTDVKIHTYSDRSKSIGNRPLYRVNFGGRFSLGNNYCANKERKDTLAHVKETLGDDFIFDEIVAIENSTNMTYDIEVDNEHYYLANGVISHNTISLFMGKLSGGVEPLFKCGYDRTTHAGEDKGVVFRVFSRSVEDLLRYNSDSMDLTNEQIKDKYAWVTESEDVAPIDRISIQSTMQEYCDGAISSTVNLPNGTSWETVYDIYLNAWKQGLKGITIFVDGCKRGNILGVDSNKKEEQPFKYDSIEPISRRGVKEVNGTTYRLKTACVDKFYLTVNKTDAGELFEIFANPSSGCQSNIGTITRLVSTALRSGIKVEEIIKDLKSMKCAGCQALRNKGEKDIELSCGNAIAKALEMSYNKEIKKEDTSGLLECPQCHQKTLKPEGKCCVCQCGYSKCD